MTALNEQIIQQTKENLSIDAIQKVIRKLDQVKYIDIIANNENAVVAEYASWNLCKVGKIVTVYDKESKQISLGMNVPEDHGCDRDHKIWRKFKYLTNDETLKEEKSPCNFNDKQR